VFPVVKIIGLVYGRDITRVGAQHVASKDLASIYFSAYGRCQKILLKKNNL
jgi:hypothetical protein